MRRDSAETEMGEPYRDLSPAPTLLALRASSNCDTNRTGVFSLARVAN